MCQKKGQTSPACEQLKQTKSIHKKIGKIINKIQGPNAPEKSALMQQALMLTPACSLAIDDAQVAEQITQQAEQATQRVARIVNHTNTSKSSVNNKQQKGSKTSIIKDDSVIDAIKHINK